MHEHCFYRAREATERRMKKREKEKKEGTENFLLLCVRSREQGREREERKVEEGIGSPCNAKIFIIREREREREREMQIESKEKGKEKRRRRKMEAWRRSVKEGEKGNDKRGKQFLSQGEVRGERERESRREVFSPLLSSSFLFKKYFYHSNF